MRYFGVLTLGILLSCNVFENENSVVPDEYIGEWNWTGTYGGWGPNIRADTVEYQMNLLISKLAEVKWYRNNELISVYEMSENETTFPSRKWVMYRSDEIETPDYGFYWLVIDCGFYVQLHENDTLKLVPVRCTDVPSVYFQKKKTK